MKNTLKEKLGFTGYLGAAMMNLCDGIVSALMTSWFLVYLTDYAGIGPFAAVLGGTILVLARVFDAVNDPLEGMIMDRAKVGKFGKYRPFMALSILMMGVGVGCLFFIPTGIAKSPVAVSIWVLVFYLIYDMGRAFCAPNLIYRSMTLDAGQRSKLMIAPRILGIVMGMVSSSLITIATGVNASIGNMNIAMGITVTALVVVTGVISLIGVLLVKEKHHAPQEEIEDKVKLTDFFLVLKENIPMRINVLSSAFSGFIWTFLFATLLYYIKWGLCTDLATGVVNQEQYGIMSLVASLLMMFPMVIGTIIATPLMKLFKSAVNLKKFLTLAEAISCGLLYVLHITGVLAAVPMLALVCAGITAFAIGIAFIPNEIMHIECMDYEIYHTKKDRSALINAFTKFLDKAQSALATATISFLLVAIGYVVDSETDAFIGDLANIPTMIDGFIVICGLVPCILGLIAWFILRKYPITDEIRAEMKEALHK